MSNIAFSIKIISHIEYLSKNEFITNKMVCDLLDISEATTKRLLKKMTDKGLLNAIGERKARKYILKIDN